MISLFPNEGKDLSSRFSEPEHFEINDEEELYSDDENHNSLSFE